jgi:hypothetical protein
VLLVKSTMSGLFIPFGQDRPEGPCYDVRRGVLRKLASTISR